MWARTRGRARMWVNVRVRVRGSEGVESWNGFWKSSELRIKATQYVKNEIFMRYFEEREQSIVCINGEFSLSPGHSPQRLRNVRTA